MKKILSTLICSLALVQASSGQQCPTPSFNSSFTPTGNQLLQMTFTNTTNASPSSTVYPVYQIKFGDGTSSTFTNYFTSTTHNYATPGTYTVKLIFYKMDSLTQAITCKDSTSQTIAVNYTPCGTTISHVINNSTSSVTFTANTPAGTPNIQYNWDFGDGTTGTGSPVTHTYTPNPGNTWTLQLTATTSGCTHYAQDTVTVGNSANLISGYVYFNNPMPNPSIKVWLIIHDTVNNTLSAVDSCLTTYNGSSSYYVFNNKPVADYLIKAALLNQTSATGYIPTYYDSSLYWNQAAIVHQQSFNFYRNIHMRSGIVTSGPGFIGGSVTMGANRSTGNGVPGQTVYLRDASNKVIKSVVTDNNGDFSFSNLPVGTYSLYPEDLNYATTPITGINITASNTNATGYNFGKTSTEIKPKTTAVANVQAQKYVIFPNPANNKLHISWEQASQNVAVTINDLAGRKVYQSNGNTASGDNLEVNTAQIPAGVYFLILENDGVKHTEKLVIQH